MQLLLFVIDAVADIGIFLNPVAEKIMNEPEHEMNELCGDEVRCCAGSGSPVTHNT
jgi:hypothetical protein